jgi:hypothetical protein
MMIEKACKTKKREDHTYLPPAQRGKSHSRSFLALQCDDYKHTKTKRMK